MTEEQFLRLLAAIDLRGYRVRDLSILHTILAHPGISGQDISQKLGLINRSSVEKGLRRLAHAKFIEDQRLAHETKQAVPSRFHITYSGIEFWEEAQTWHTNTARDTIVPN